MLWAKTDEMGNERSSAILKDLAVDGGLERNLLRVREGVSSDEDGADGGRVVYEWTRGQEVSSMNGQRWP